PTVQQRTAAVIDRHAPELTGGGRSAGVDRTGDQGDGRGGDGDGERPAADGERGDGTARRRGFGGTRDSGDGSDGEGGRDGDGGDLRTDLHGVPDVMGCMPCSSASVTQPSIGFGGLGGESQEMVWSPYSRSSPCRHIEFNVRRCARTADLQLEGRIPPLARWGTEALRRHRPLRRRGVDGGGGSSRRSGPAWATGQARRDGPPSARPVPGPGGQGDRRLLCSPPWRRGPRRPPRHLHREGPGRRLRYRVR